MDCHPPRYKYLEFPRFPSAGYDILESVGIMLSRSNSEHLEIYEKNDLLQMTGPTYAARNQGCHDYALSPIQWYSYQVEDSQHYGYQD